MGRPCLGYAVQKYIRVAYNSDFILMNLVRQFIGVNIYPDDLGRRRKILPFCANLADIQPGTDGNHQIAFGDNEVGHPVAVSTDEAVTVVQSFLHIHGNHGCHHRNADSIESFFPAGVGARTS